VSWYDKKGSLSKKLLGHIVTMSGNRQMADSKGTFPSPHGRQDAQVKQVSLLGEKNGEF
jgi:hypothetical protein